MQAAVGSAAVVVGIGLAPAVAHAADPEVDCSAPRPADALYYDCEETDTQNKTGMRTLATSDGQWLRVTDHAVSWNRLKNWDLCTRVGFYNAANVNIGYSDEHCYHMKKRDTKSDSWQEQLTPYEIANTTYIEIVHWKK